MSASEMRWRLSQRWRQRGWRRGWRQGRAPQPPALDPVVLQRQLRPAGPVLDGDQSTSAALLAAADAALAHRWHFLGRDHLEPEIDWHRDPAAPSPAPRCFAFDVPHRAVDVIGDVKVIWEKNRHQHWPLLAAAWRVSGDTRYAQECERQWLSWMTTNPWMEGVNWSHPLEHGLRLISWVWSERFLRGSEVHRRLFAADAPVWRQVWWHQQFIVEAHSRGSSANNHLIGELAGLYVAACAWPFFAESHAWRQWAGAALVRELQAQTHVCGLNREQAWDYQLFVLEFAVSARLAARDGGWQVPEGLDACIRSMAEATAAMTRGWGPEPRYGDGDDGRALVLGPPADDRIAWLLHAAAALSGARVGPVPHTLHARLAELGEPPQAPLPAVARDRFADAGWYLLRSAGDSPRLAALMDVAPLGYLAIAAHGHADALQVLLSCDGEPLLIDPGTYVYHDQPAWRDWFRGTAAHNTVCIDDADQSQSGGTFLWTRHASSRLLRQDATSLQAEHDGYAGIGCWHQRTLTRRDDGLVIDDRIRATGAHRSCWHWHIDPRWTATLDDNKVVMTHGHVQVELCWDGEAVPSLWHGGEQVAGVQDSADAVRAPYLGWYSPGFGRRQVCTCLRLSMRHQQDVALRFHISARLLVQAVAPQQCERMLS